MGWVSKHGKLSSASPLDGGQDAVRDSAELLF